MVAVVVFERQSRRPQYSALKQEIRAQSALPDGLYDGDDGRKERPRFAASHSIVGPKLVRTSDTLPSGYYLPQYCLTQFYSQGMVREVHVRCSSARLSRFSQGRSTLQGAFISVQMVSGGRPSQRRLDEAEGITQATVRQQIVSLRWQTRTTQNLVLHHKYTQRRLLYALTLLRSLVDLIQKRCEHLPLHALLAQLHHRNLPDQPCNPLVCLLLIFLIPFPHPNLFKHLLYPLLRFVVLLAIVVVEHTPLLRRTDGESSVDAPRTLVIDDVRSDLADLLRRARKIEKVVLDLEVFAERDEDRQRELVRVRGDVGRWWHLRVRGRCRAGGEGR